MAAQSTAMLELEPGSMASVSTARSFVRRTLAANVPDEVVADLQLVASELVTNAFEHGEPRSVVVAVYLDDGCASVTIKSHQRTVWRVADVNEWTIPEPERLAGRGLGIVSAIADDLDVETVGNAVTITVHRKW